MFFVLTTNVDLICDTMISATPALADVDVFDWFRGTSVPALSVQFEVLQGDSVPDFLLSSLTSPIISRSLILALRQGKFSGWDTFPVTLIDCPDGCSEHYGLVVRGRSGSIDDSRSRRELRAVGDGPLRSMPVGLFFDKSTWDGAQIFAPAGSSLVFVTDEVREWLEKGHFRGLAFVPQDAALNLSAEFFRRTP